MSDALSWTRLNALLRKEFLQILGNAQLLYILLFPPIVMLTILSYALNPIVKHLDLAIVDESKTPASRELIDAFSADGVFVPRLATDDVHALYRAVQSGRVDAGLVIPSDYARSRARREPADVQLVVDGVNTFVANLCVGYASRIVQSVDAGAQTLLLSPQITFAYDPGLVTAWYFVPGLLAGIVMITSVLASASESVREKDEGTLEQLLMTPASSLEVLLAKIGPMFVLFLATMLVSLGLSRAIFGLPFRGDFLLFVLACSLFLVGTIAIGILIATFASTKQQAVLVSIFVAIPLMMLSGAFAPIESMPPLWQTLSQVNPLRHAILILRDVILKGAGIEVVWPDVLVLAAFAALTIAVCAARYRSQLR